MSTATYSLQQGTSRRAKALARSSFGATIKLLVPFFLLTLVVLAFAPGLLRLLFPAEAVFFGYRLYKRNESHYLSFALWICMLCPLLRRVVDWRTSYQQQSLILLAPLLLMLLPAMHLQRRLARVAPFVRVTLMLALGGITFGAGVGMIRHPGQEVVAATLMWLGPLMLCIFVASMDDKQALGRVLGTTFVWAVIVMSLYGIYQFVVAPPWDTYWLNEVNVNSISPSFGHPERYGIRVWSTMNAPGALALFMSAALIWLATLDGLLPMVASTLGYITLGLTLVRTAWMMTIVGLLIYILGIRKKISARSMISGVFTVALVGGALIYVSQYPSVSDRLKSFTSLKSDESFGARTQMYNYMKGYILANPLGDGLQSVGEMHGYLLDSTIVELFAEQGWIGGLCYTAGLIYMFAYLARRWRSHAPEKVGAVAILFGCATQAMSGDILFRQGGILLWLFLGAWANFSSVRPRPALAPPSRA